MKIKSLVEAYVDKFGKGQSVDDDDDAPQISPELKANGERAKVKAARWWFQECQSAFLWV